MRRTLPLLLIVAALAAAGLFAAWSASGSSSVALTAKLGPAAERPAPKGVVGASGKFTATLTGLTLSWRLTFTRLTGRAVAAHIHLGRRGVAGPVAVPLCGPCLPGAHGKVTVSAKTKRALLAGTAYVNIHTTRNAAGEIRGQILEGLGTAPVRQTTADTGSNHPR